MGWPEHHWGGLTKVSHSAPIDNVFEALEHVGSTPKKVASGWIAKCPAHDDQTPSLSIGVGDGGRALVHCHAGCSISEVIAACGLEKRDLMPPDDVAAQPLTTAKRRGRGNTSGPNGTEKPQSVAVANRLSKRPTFPTLEAAVTHLESWKGESAQAWQYVDEQGDPRGATVRLDGESGKDYKPLRCDGGSWSIGGMPAPRPLYRLDDLCKAPEGSRVYVAEGEKAADALRSCGLIATTSPHGSNSAKYADWSSLAGHDVVILSDHDEAGEHYAEVVADLVHKAGARSVRIVRLVERWPTLPVGGDAADVLDIEGGDTVAVRDGIEALAESTPPDERKPTGDPLRFKPFPVDAIPEPNRRYVIEAARAIGCDESYIALPLLSSLAGAIGNTCRVKIRRIWSEPAIVWTAIVGESGTMKSPALELAMRFVRKRQHHTMKEHKRAIQEWESDHARYEVELATWKQGTRKGGISDPPTAPERPVCPRTWTDDATTEAIVVRLRENPRGLLVARDELSGWFDFGRYTTGKGAEDVAKWQEVFGGRSLIVDRKTSDTEYVPRATVSIAGGIQPEMLRRVLTQEHQDNGLAARFLFAMPPRKPRRWIEADVSESVEAMVESVFDRLYAMELATDAEGDIQPRLFPLTPDAKSIFTSFVNEHGHGQMERVGSEAAAWSKLEGYSVRFALVIHCARVAAGDPSIENPDVIDAESVNAGIRLVRWFAQEADRIYAYLGQSEAEREDSRLAEWITGKSGAVTVRELTQGPRPYRGDTERAKGALDRLVDRGLAEWVPVPGGRTLECKLR